MKRRLLQWLSEIPRRIKDWWQHRFGAADTSIRWDDGEEKPEDRF